jgi:hypothetical protein
MADLDNLTVEINPSKGKQLSESDTQHSRRKDQ